MATGIIAPRRGQQFSDSGVPTLRMLEWMESITSGTNTTGGQIEINRLAIIVLSQEIVNIKVRLDALEALAPLPVLTSVDYQPQSGRSEAVKCNNTGSINITMPPNPTSQQTISIKRAGGVVNLIGNGRLIDGMSTIKMTRIFTNLTLNYTSSTNTWDII